MIIGKSLTALGGGGLKPEIRVTAKAGALLNLHFKDSSIILQSYQLGTDETTHTFIVNVSETAYVVDDVTNGASVEVLVDSVCQYNVEIQYILYLYKNGNTYTSVTGGWGATAKKVIGAGNTRVPSLTFNDDNMFFYIPSQSSTSNATYEGALMTNNKIDTTNYSLLKAEWTGYIPSGGDSNIINGWSVLYLCNSRTTDNEVVKKINGIQDNITTLDISSVTGSYYVGLQTCTQFATNILYHNVYKVWLE